MKGISPYFSLRANWLLIIVFCILTSCSGTRRAFQPVEKTFSSSPVFEKGFVGMMVYDPEKKEVLYQHNSGKYFTPASNMKLFTFYTGLKVLGDSVPGLRYTVSNDTLYFTGTGDPSFLNPDLPASPVVDFLKNRNEKLVFVAPGYTESRLGPGWAWDDYNAYYSAERSAFPVYANQVIFDFAEGARAPKVYPQIFADSLSSLDDASEFERVKRQPYVNLFQYANPRANEDYTQNVPFTNSPELVANLLQDTLGKTIHLKEEAPKMAFSEEIFSIPSDSLYKQMLEVSDNFLAEQILLLAAGKLSDTLKTSVAIDYMKENHLQDLPDEPVWRDGSGLSRYNLVTPRSMVRLLEKIKEEVPYEDLFVMLPVGGKSGTLKNRLHADEAFVFAKTGSLSNNHSLSGYLKTKKGKIFIFSFMNSNYTVPSSILRAEMDRILTLIRDNN